jgi:predicted transcriptional regulator
MAISQRNPDMDSKIKIMAYLGQLKPGEWVLATKLCLDLNLRFTTGKNSLTQLEDRGLIAKRKETDGGTVVLFCIPPGTLQRKWKDDRWIDTPYIPPEWDDAYGKHPHSI